MWLLNVGSIRSGFSDLGLENPFLISPPFSNPTFQVISILIIIDAFTWHGIVKKLNVDEIFQNPMGNINSQDIWFPQYIRKMNVFSVTAIFAIYYHESNIFNAMHLFLLISFYKKNPILIEGMLRFENSFSFISFSHEYLITDLYSNYRNIFNWVFSKIVKNKELLRWSSNNKQS